MKKELGVGDGGTGPRKEEQIVQKLKDARVPTMGSVSSSDWLEYRKGKG